MNEREKFEAFARSKGWNLCRSANSDDYAFAVASGAWAAWNAARDQPAAPAGHIVGYMDPNAEFLLPRAGACVIMGKVEVCLWQTPGGKYTKPLYETPPEEKECE